MINIKYNTVIKSTFEAVDCEVLKICYILNKAYPTLSEELLFNFEFVLREALNNAVEHGNKMVESEQIKLTIELKKTGIEIDVWDQGEGFDLSKNQFKTDELTELQERNRGFTLIKALGYAISNGIGHVHLLLQHDLTGLLNKKEDIAMDLIYSDHTLDITLYKSLTGSNIKGLIEEMKVILDKLSDDIVEVKINLAEAQSIDSMGITFLVGIYKSLSTKGKVVRLTGLSESMIRLFKMMKLEELFFISGRE